MRDTGATGEHHATEITSCQVSLPVLAACLTLGIAGCGSDDIAFNGGIFDAVGLSDAGKAKTGDPKMAERAPLVVPPSLDRLPAPGEAAPSSQIADIKDPDEEKKLSQAELQAKQDEYCKVNYDDPKARGDEVRRKRRWPAWAMPQLGADGDQEVEQGRRTEGQ